jgi:Na+/H+-dicarboxylate symporter
MNAISFSIILVILPFASWGFGSLMRTIGILSGWNPKRTFWISYIAYAIALILVFWSSTGYEYTIFVYMFVGVGILSPFVNIAVKWLSPYVIATSSSSSTNTNPDYQDAVKKEEPSLQKPRSSSPDNGLQHKPEAAKKSVASKNLKPNTSTESGRIFVSYRRSDSADIY